MQTNNLGYPRIGSNRELKKSSEKYWAGKISVTELIRTGVEIRKSNWELQKKAGIDLIPSNDFSFYDHVLDMSLMLGAIPKRYHKVILDKSNSEIDLYFAMARGYQKNNLDIKAMEMTKWFDTNYHYIVPEFTKDQKFNLFSTKIVDEFLEAKNLGIQTKPVLIGPVSFILLGKEKETGFHKLDLLKNLLPVYIDILTRLKEAQVEWVQFDEPFLGLDLDSTAKEAFIYAYEEINKTFPTLKKLVATYFEGLKDNTTLALSLPVQAIHIDLVRCPQQLDEILQKIPSGKKLSLGIVDGRNIWKNNYQHSLKTIHKTIEKIGEENVMIAPSCSLIHSPCDLDLETNEEILTSEIKQWMAFAKQKIEELASLKKLIEKGNSEPNTTLLKENIKAHRNREISDLIHDQRIKSKITDINLKIKRENTFPIRKEKQNYILQLPILPTTTIGSFPQTKEVRSWRSQYKKKQISAEQYEQLLRAETEKAIRIQEKIGLDVLVHGEFERNDMVEYFGEQLKGFVFSKNGWVQSYGSRCVKPPIIYGDVSRPEPMTVQWSTYAQSLTDKKVKGMLTGPVTILQWSFVRNDQPRSETCNQIAVAIKEEVEDLEKAGIQIIQIDEPAIREGLPLRKSDWQEYLQWAVKSFKISSSSVKDETQIHTHMCYSEFNDIIENIAEMDADVITIECSRSNMELLDVFSKFNYPNDIGPGVYDIHSPRIPSKEEMERLLDKASKVIPVERLWVNPDCGLKTRNWEETEKALKEMVLAASEMRKQLIM
ncbi:5-methyltetrahydropteroyltriglutamate--homocysteine S-methyltransferase [Apibacter adventoris]|uniref:5-methyltetrahydropteroyltriglutamate-- homocysteine S-methyltransferase n=1 Tax=Apibacter adventoris TaxID=1679466 RepID=UPI000CF5E727|nr:5-methyltetrahydropteroyltriglutamate--homocysteine S-methyltransferase [Apibacter adventoris]PQL95870.1 5-methyltetrahydropteroyltriglutamate--homocysteine S-methyltransferase [Apibacter adventoris]